MIWIASGDAADMRSLLDAVRMARVALSVIRQNLAWAVAYNLVAVPLAVAGLVTPWVAALGMSASSLLVVGNSMRLLRPRQPAGASPLEASSPVTASAV
jgi:Cu2+-exporting ATPase